MLEVIVLPSTLFSCSTHLKLVKESFQRNLALFIAQPPCENLQTLLIEQDTLVSKAQQGLTWGRVQLYVEDLWSQDKCEEKSKTK